jgi:hypothetical protein
MSPPEHSESHHVVTGYDPNFLRLSGDPPARRRTGAYIYEVAFRQNARLGFRT